MAVFSVDSDAVIAATATIRGTADRIQGEATSLMSQLQALQSSWTGAASGMFQGSVEQWRAAQRTVEDALGTIHLALAAAGQQYAEAEQANMGLFR
ncbi:WXG100 family type VII secretion target [Microbacterium caowuchunii]|uniref:ESAT-6-like protein n=1 Tax=Microbacterium caowuchunii TaxID=2614638 RepID=A0A5J6KVK1_9MICO|nr:WXG100 family type VII secretion target [Microbacterium caowuchunii]KAA9131104.1 WXG100 family type VII secretion target [Microbacterium caowuchunii]QEV99384.1 WXG100 family type VII secretion target [Microbacterium caowuchunii]